MDQFCENTSYSLFVTLTVLLIDTHIDHIIHQLATCHMAILTNVAYDQLVTNMVNMGVYQKHSEKLVTWPKL